MAPFSPNGTGHDGVTATVPAATAPHLACSDGSPPLMPLLPTPFTVVVDSREQLPYRFARPLARLGKQLYAVQTTVGTLKSGDYSIAGFENRVAVERKSLQDAYSTLGTGRRRFVDELIRLSTYDFAAVVVEATLATLMLEPPWRSRLRPKTVVASIIAWQQRYPRIHWWLVESRDVGEAMTVRMLDRYWREQTASGKGESK